MKRTVISLILATTAATIVFAQIGCGDASANSTNNANPAQKQGQTDKNKKLKNPDYMGTQ